MLVHPAPVITERFRGCPRPVALRDASFAQRFDWHTLFYDVYRAGSEVVFQGPPLFGFLDSLKAAAPFRGRFGFPRFAARHFGQDKRGEIWLHADDNTFHLDGELGRFDVAVQPDLAGLFAGRRVLHTLSKDNDLHWIIDWVRFHGENHGADAVLIYDNGSSAYSPETLDRTLAEAFPGMAVVTVSWPFAYGPQGGLAGAVDGVEAPWDSDFCQTGSLQHARFRFLRRARSVLNADIDELVLGPPGDSIFAATERSRHGFVKFPGRWITGALRAGARANGEWGLARHADFVLADQRDDTVCPPKWCIVPARHGRRASWSAHNLFGARANRTLSEDFAYRHMRAISTGWKEARGHDCGKAGLAQDTALAGAMRHAGLARSIDMEMAAGA